MQPPSQFGRQSLMAHHPALGQHWESLLLSLAQSPLRPHWHIHSNYHYHLFHYCPYLKLFHCFAPQGHRPVLAETLEPVHGGDGELVLLLLVPPEAPAGPGGLPGSLGGGGGLGGLLPPPLPHQARLAQDSGELCLLFELCLLKLSLPTGSKVVGPAQLILSGMLVLCLSFD